MHLIKINPRKTIIIIFQKKKEKKSYTEMCIALHSIWRKWIYNTDNYNNNNINNKTIKQ